MVWNQGGERAREHDADELIYCIAFPSLDLSGCLIAIGSTSVVCNVVHGMSNSIAGTGLYRLELLSCTLSPEPKEDRTYNDVNDECGGREEYS